MEHNPIYFICVARVVVPQIFFVWKVVAFKKSEFEIDQKAKGVAM